MALSSSAVKVADPIRLESAYSDREAVWQKVVSHGPYPLMAGSEGYVELMGSYPLTPFFRTVWARDGVGQDEQVERLLHDGAFMQAARVLFDAEVVRPTNLIVNVMGPMHAGGRHVDTPTFRGLRREDIPMWLLVVMGMSGLFDRWSVRVAGALTWFYDDSDGEFEFWPHGLDAPSETERGPFGNVALVADNDLMYHEVGRIGNPDAFSRDVKLTLSSTIEAVGEEGWEIRDGESTIGRLRRDQVRVSLLWKAITFVNEDAVRIHDEGVDDLNLDTIVSIFSADLVRRGLDVMDPVEPLNDPAWAKTLTSTYMHGTA
jgi:hypothetical protein